MIIPALIRRYDHLASTPGSGIAPAGYSEQQVSFKIILTKRGELHAIEPVFVEIPEPVKKAAAATSGKARRKLTTDQDSPQPVKMKRRPQRLLLPGQSKPSGSGLNPCTLWDNAAYMLGFKPDDPKPERTKEAFKAFREHHEHLAEQLGDPAVKAVAKFLQAWSPSDARQHKDLPLIATNFGVFQIRGEGSYVHESPAFKAWWDSQQSASPSDADEADRLVGFSLAHGQRAPLARLHEPKIKGVAGAQSSGATIVSFNQDSFTSYAKEQGANSPLAEHDAFKYCTALNALTTDERHRVRIAGDTYVFWAEASPEQDDVLAGFFGAALDRPSESVNTQQLHDLMARVRNGQLPSEFGSASNRFCILGLAPNMSRLSVRLWMVSTVRDVVDRLASHADALRIEPAAPDAAGLSIRRLVAETAPPKGGFADEDRVSPALAGQVLRAVLTGQPYPRALLAGVLDRVRVEGLADSESRKDVRDAQHRRCAVIRAVLTRNHQMEVPVALDTNRRDAPYLLGRLFAVLEYTQKNALGENLNRTIKDAYYGSASSTPAAIFPRLLSLSRHHLNKIEHRGQRITREKESGAIIDGLVSFPRTLSMEAQGLFAIGYYHQRQSYFTKKSEQSGDDN
ncbi:MAG: type I-C CRISPR-associated protein Cas8c/Csd1 [Phycisphaerae bacterium]|nr:type I-C CRISPR-associated protein Cas8c/Csd1 [Phycisphaerae bacterium]